MSYPVELCKLVIRNIEIIEEAPNVVAEVEKKLFTAINERIEERVIKHSRATWAGVYSLVTGKIGGTYFAPRGWLRLTEDEEDYWAWYECWLVKGDINFTHKLPQAIGLKNAALAIGFDSAFAESVDDKREKMANFYEATSAIKDAELLLHINADYIYTHIPLDVDALADGFPDFTKALNPLDDALTRLFSVHEHFDRYVTGRLENG